MKQFRITEDADQKFSATLSGRRVSLRLWYSGAADRWSLDIYRDNLPILQGRRVVTGTNLIKGLGLGVGAIFAVGSDLGRNAFTDGKLNLYHATDEEIEAIQ